MSEFGVCLGAMSASITHRGECVHVQIVKFRVAGFYKNGKCGGTRAAVLGADVVLGACGVSRAVQTAD